LAHFHKFFEADLLLLKQHCSPGNFGGDSMLPFQRKCLFSGTHNFFLFQMVSKIIVAEVFCFFFLQNQHKAFEKHEAQFVIFLFQNKHNRLGK
jgi:hypothetical protein